jgi:ABC-type branched-subunit amino acid transport system substrate-binding protein
METKHYKGRKTQCRRSPFMAQDTIKIAYIDPLSGAFANVGDMGYRHFNT